MNTKELIEVGQTFRGQSDQYSELIVELADALNAALIEMHARELHHFETEQEVVRLRGVIQATYSAWHMESRQSAIDLLIPELGTSPTEAAP